MSLINLHYGINDRQPTNPLTDTATDLLTPFIQSLISNQIRTPQQVILPIKVDKIQQGSNKVDKTPQEPIKLIEYL